MLNLIEFLQEEGYIEKETAESARDRLMDFKEYATDAKAVWRMKDAFNTIYQDMKCISHSEQEKINLKQIEEEYGDLIDPSYGAE